MDRLQILSSHLCPEQHKIQPSCTSSSSPPPSSFTSLLSPERWDSYLRSQSIPGPWPEGDEEYGNQREFENWNKELKGHELYKIWEEKYGTLYAFYGHEGRKLLRIVISDPVEVRKLLKENPPKAKGYEKSVILGRGVLSISDMDEWAKQRRLLKEFFTTDSIKHTMPHIISDVKNLLNKLQVSCDRREPVEIHEELSQYAFLVIGHSALDEESEYLDKRATELREAFNVAAKIDIQRVRTNKLDDYVKAKSDIQSFVQETMKRRKETQCPVHQPAASACPVAHTHQSALTEKKKITFMNIIDSKDEKGVPNFDEKTKSDELSTFMFAGHETTAHTMSWSILELARHPKFQVKLQNEIDTKLKKYGGLENLQYKNLFEFEYLTLVINETLRLWPVVAVGTLRFLEDDVVVQGYTLPKGALVTFPHYLVHRNKKVWGEDADEFNPERKWHNDAFIPFTVSPRDCLGRNLALLEMRITLIALLSRFKFILKDPNQKVEVLNSLTLYPKELWVQLERR